MNLEDEKKSIFPDVKCQQPMGIDQGILPSSLITVSSVYGGKVAQFGKSMLQLSSGGGWKPATDSNNEFIKVQGVSPKKRN